MDLQAVADSAVAVMNDAVAAVGPGIVGVIAGLVCLGVVIALIKKAKSA